MARRKNDESISDDLLEISTKLSWKVNLSLALMSYLALHYAATLPQPVAKDAGSFSSVLYKQILISFSQPFQYILPLIFIAGAVVSSINRKKRARLLAQQSSLESIRALSWQEFELLVGEAFRRKGYEVHENGGGGADGGIDLILSKGGRKTIVQCKQWRKASVGVSLIRELYGVMAAENASDCVLVSSGFYTSEARLFAEDKPIWLIDGPALLELVSEVQPKVHQIKPEPIEEDSLLENLCPFCGSAMVQRIAKKGINAGNTFFGCSKFPTCRGTR